MNQQYTKTVLHRDFFVDALITVHYFEYNKTYRFDGEAHPFWELLYVDKGAVNVTADGVARHLEQGDLIFHKPNEFHSVFADGIVAPNLVVISFDCSTPAMSRFDGTVLKAGEAERTLLARIINEAKGAFLPPLGDPTTTMLHPNDDAPFGSQQMIALMMEQLLITLLRRDNGDSFSRIASSIKSRSDNDLVDRIIDFMQENLFGNLTFADVCRFSAQSATNLKTIFKSVTGDGVMSYYRTLKINEAKRMLREGDGNITQIADRLGYNSVHYFSRYFKRVTGMTPSEYTLSIQAKL